MPGDKVDTKVADEDDKNIYYICKKTLQAVRKDVASGKKITKESIKNFIEHEELDEEEIVVPVDMKGLDDDFDSLEEMVEKLGEEGTAKCFIKAADQFEKSKLEIPEEDRPQEMTVGDWRLSLEDDEGEEEEDGEEDEEGEEEEEEEEEAEEPVKKKAKKS
eukprot:TRINITY_DN226_c2_g1_i2.p1 TRINITY_DN226_c2_g1~~TRINITY_DN226_c2_g1_i2.p1  ORF type:complete len:161 (+),score=74.91 TRINITY_DN226_c2_g1_i2:94-576(+)